MRERGLVSVHFRQQVGGVGGVQGAQLAVRLLRFFESVSIEIKKAEFQQGITITGPDVDGFLVRSLGGFPFVLLAKTLSQIVKIIRFRCGGIS